MIAVDSQQQSIFRFWRQRSALRNNRFVSIFVLSVSSTLSAITTAGRLLSTNCRRHHLNAMHPIIHHPKNYVLARHDGSDNVMIITSGRIAGMAGTMGDKKVSRPHDPKDSVDAVAKAVSYFACSLLFHSIFVGNLQTVQWTNSETPP